jgi:uncharacterized damage-inducible protein DinB
MHHCSGFSPVELSKELDGFGYPSIRSQLHHVIGAERYWMGVFQGQMLIDENDADFESIEALLSFRARVAGATQAYLHACSDEEVSRARKVLTWGHKEVDLSPALAILRTQTHIFQHQGQVAAMARLLGRPIPAGLDFPIY